MPIEGKSLNGFFSRTLTFRITWGNVLRSAINSPSVFPLRWTTSNTSSAVSKPSPVVALAGNRICPDCSPPSDAPAFSISSSTYLSPTGARNMAIPVRLNAASNPMFDIVVATTRSPASNPRACRSRAHTSITASPFTTLPCSSEKSARSASPSNVIPIDAPLRFTSLATTLACIAPQ